MHGYTLPVLLASALVACPAPATDSWPTTDGPSQTTNPTTGDLAGDGIIFKGPMAEGTDVVIQPLDEALEPVGEPTIATVGPSGRYTATGRGLLRIQSTGLTYDEAKGTFATQPLTLRGFGDLNEQGAALQLNLLNDLTFGRVERLVGQGVPFPEATERAEQEVSAVFALGDGTLPGRGAQNPVFGDGFDQAWLLVASALVSQVGVTLEQQGTGDRVTFLDDLRGVFSAGLPPTPELLALLADAQRRLDPALPTLGLRELGRIQGANEVLPNVDALLDTDADGFRNDVDVCPFVPDPLQVDSEGRGWGDACNARVTAISIADGFGCVLLAADGSLACWRDDAPVLGGVPPHPNAFPTSTEAPWGDAPGLDATGYVDVALGPGIACASTPTGVSCFDGQAVWDVDLGDTRTDLSVNASRVCSLDDEGNVTCLDHGGGNATVLPVDAQDVAPFGEFGVCVRDQNQALACFDATTGYPLDGIGLPAGAYRALDGVQEASGAYGCALTTDNGSIACWGAVPGVPPTDSGYDVIATGVGLACAARSGEVPVCWRDPTVCPPIPEGDLRIPRATDVITVEDCVIGGVADDGLGYAWPRYWFRRPGAVP